MLALDEIVGELVEGSVEEGILLGVSLEHADQDTAVPPIVTVEREAGSLADLDMVGNRGSYKILPQRLRLVEHVQEGACAAIEKEEKAERGFIENRAHERLVGTQLRGERRVPRKIVERELDLLAPEGQAIHERRDPRDRDALCGVELQIGSITPLEPGRRGAEIGEMDRSGVAIDDGEPDVPGVSNTHSIEPEIIVILGRIDFHPVRQAAQHIGEHVERLPRHRGRYR